MKKEYLVSNKEFLFPEESVIISKTDLKGKITFVSPDFASISGYTEEELIGKPHKIVRHPDMPREAFKDLWATVQKGLPWNGYVKNLRKNGDYYWVEATVIPIRENGQIIGYMSVRKKPNREKLKNIERQYTQMKQENFSISFRNSFGNFNFIKLLYFFVSIVFLSQCLNLFSFYITSLSDTISNSLYAK